MKRKKIFSLGNLFSTVTATADIYFPPTLKVESQNDLFKVSYCIETSVLVYLSTKIWYPIFYPYLLIYFHFSLINLWIQFSNTINQDFRGYHNIYINSKKYLFKTNIFDNSKMSIIPKISDLQHTNK